MPARVDVDPRILLRELLHPRDLIRNRVVASHRAVVRVLKRLRSPRRPHAVDRDDDEAELGEGLAIAARRGERAAAGAAGLRAGIDVVDDRILLRRIEVRRPEEQAVDVGLAVVRGHLDRHRRLPAGGEQLGDVGLFERHHQPPVARRAARQRAARRGVEYVSTRYLPDGDSCIACVPSSGVSDTMFLPSRLDAVEVRRSTDPVPSRARLRRTRSCAPSHRRARSA